MSNIIAHGDTPSGDIRFYGNDIVDASGLPPGAQEALSKLRERVSDMMDLSELASRKWNEAREAHDEASRQLSIHAPFPGGDLHTKLHGKRVEAKKFLMAVQDRRDAIGERRQGQSRLLTRVESYIRSLRTSAIQAAPSPATKLPSADRLFPEIDKQRNEIATLFADRHEILSKATPSAEIKVRARAEIEELARRGCPDVTYMVNHGPSEGVIWPDYEGIARGRGIGVPLPGDIGHTRFIQAPHLPMIAWLFRDRLLEAIEAEIDANSEDEHALPLEQRIKKLAEIDARVLAAERVEVAMVRHSNGAVDYRDDTDPRAFLGVEGPPLSED